MAAKKIYKTWPVFDKENNVIRTLNHDIGYTES